MRALWQRVQSNVEFGLPQGQSSCTRGENAARVRNLRQRVPAPILFEIARGVQAWDKVSTSGRCADRNQRSERHKKVGRRRVGSSEFLNTSLDATRPFSILRNQWMQPECPMLLSSLFTTFSSFSFCSSSSSLLLFFFPLFFFFFPSYCSIGSEFLLLFLMLE